MGYLTKMNGKYGQNGFSTVGFSILGQPPRAQDILVVAIINLHREPNYWKQRVKT